jgi:predicted kinase
MTMINTLLNKLGYQLVRSDVGMPELLERLHRKDRRICQLAVQVSYYKRKLNEARKAIAA